MKFIDKIAWLHIKDKKLLCARSKGKEMWYLPGGKREEGETDLDTLAREIEEELSAGIDTEQAALFGIFEAQADGKSEGTIVRMTCYTAPFQGDLVPSAEIEEIAWLTMQDSEKLSAASRIIFQELKDRELIE